jgi:hypothetical protein
VRRWRDRAADGAEALLELLRPVEFELVTVVVGELLVALRHALLELVVIQDGSCAHRRCPLKRHALKVVPVINALQVGLAPRRLRGPCRRSTARRP